jgi:hypothetical protein
MVMERGGGPASHPIPNDTMKLYEIVYLPTKRSRKAITTGIYADSAIQARRFLRQQIKARIADIKVLRCEAIA